MEQNDFYAKVVNAQYQDKNRAELILQKLKKMEEQKSSQEAIKYITKIFGEKQNQKTFSIEGINIEIKNNDHIFSIKIDYDNKVQCFLFKKLDKKETDFRNKQLNDIVNNFMLKNYIPDMVFKNNVNTKIPITINYQK